MNYKLSQTDADFTILKTGAAVDNEAVFPTLQIARAHLVNRVEIMIDKLKEAKKTALRTKERDLPLEEAPKQEQAA